jgi:diguanylate cyclase (GGDEF)-like protein
MSLIGNKTHEQKQSATQRSHALHVLQNSEQSSSDRYGLYLRQRLALAVGLTAVLGFVLADFFSAGFTTLFTLDWQLIALIFPSLLLPLALTFPPRNSASSYIQYVLIGIFVFGVSLASYMSHRHHQSNWFNQESLTLVTIYIYFLSGLPLLRAMFCGLATWLAFTMGGTVGAGILEWISANPYLLIANFAGALGLFYLEWHSRKLHERQALLLSDAMCDELTGMLNSRAIHKHLRRVWLHARRENRGLCVLRVDIDNFKELNRQVGRALGDSAMRHISALLEAEVKRPLDAVGRSGTDEFIAVWYNCESAAFTEIVRRLPGAVINFRVSDSLHVEPLTISGGAVMVNPQSDTDEEWEQFVESLDENLARARLKGRNEIVVTKFEFSAVSGTEQWNMKTVEMIAVP